MSLRFTINYLLLLLLFIYLLDFIYRGSLFSIFATLIYHKVLTNNKTEQDTEQDKQTKRPVSYLNQLAIQTCKLLRPVSYLNQLAIQTCKL